MELKKALIKDIIALKEICISAYSLSFHDHWNEGGLAWYLDNEFSQKRLASDLADDSTEYYFILHQEEHVGFLKIKFCEPSYVIENSVELEKIYVLPDFKGMGIGKMALNSVINAMKNKRKNSIFLSVIDTNISSIAFYKQLGFKFHSKTTLDVPYFKEELKGMHRMIKYLN